MQKVNTKEARRNISQLIDKVNTGEEIMIQVEPEKAKPLQFPDRSAFRSKLPPMKQSSASLIRNLRDERG